MAAGQARAEFARTGRRVQILDRNRQPRWHPLWEGLGYIARQTERGDFVQIVNGPGLRPYHLGKTDRQWTYNPDFRPTPAEIRLSAADEEFGQKHAGRIIVEPHIKKKASPNKDYGWVRWSRVVWSLMERHGIRVTQLGASGTPTLEGVDFIQTDDFMKAVAVLANARAVILPEGGLMHAAAAFNVPGVIVFGGFTPVELTGYECHVKIGASIGDACGMRVPCKHCEAWMESITPSMIVRSLVSVLDANSSETPPPSWPTRQVESPQSSR